MATKFFSNEIVFRGHPDKVCDQISAAILKEYIKQDKSTRAGIECLIKDDLLLIAGEVTSTAKVDHVAVANRVLKDIGYKEKYCILEKISKQSNDIAKGVDNYGAGDNGMMFGFACDKTSECLPTAQVILQRYAAEYDRIVRADSNMHFKPDGKAQITGKYDDEFNLLSIETFTICYQNSEEQREFTDSILMNIAKIICDDYKVEIKKFLINPTGEFKVGGSFADAGLTGRKIVVDAYQSFANVGGGCMNGKDPTKVDFSGSHKARELAVRFLKDYRLSWCEVQLSYAIGVDKPVAIYINSDIGNFKNAFLLDFYDECTPKNIIQDLKLLDADFEELAKFGHFR